jgi:hypothetical protein
MSLTKRLVAVMTSVKGLHIPFADSALIHITPRIHLIHVTPRVLIIVVIVVATFAFANCSSGVTMLTAICMIAYKFGIAEAPDVVFTRTA